MRTHQIYLNLHKFEMLQIFVLDNTFTVILMLTLQQWDLLFNLDFPAVFNEHILLACFISDVHEGMNVKLFPHALNSFSLQIPRKSNGQDQKSMMRLPWKTISRDSQIIWFHDDSNTQSWAYKYFSLFLLSFLLRLITMVLEFVHRVPTILGDAMTAATAAANGLTKFLMIEGEERLVPPSDIAARISPGRNRVWLTC